MSGQHIQAHAMSFAALCVKAFACLHRLLRLSFIDDFAGILQIATTQGLASSCCDMRYTNTRSHFIAAVFAVFWLAIIINDYGDCFQHLTFICCDSVICAIPTRHPSEGFEFDTDRYIQLAGSCHRLCLHLQIKSVVESAATSSDCL
jgi:hypothetical protein